MKEKLKDVTLTLFDNYYMVCNYGTYFKVGLREGRILNGLLLGKQSELIANEECVTQDEMEYIIATFETNGIIGKKVKEKFNVLHIKIPLFNIDSQLELLCNFFHKYKLFRFSVLSIIGWCIGIGIVSIAMRYNDIFRIKSLILPPWQYVLVYILYTINIFCHELGHGIACKYFGGKVGKIGVAFILFNPAMYCDISAVREFRERYKQVLCSAAGFIVNAFFVGIFSILYYFISDNFFKVMIILNATSIVINAIPFIRLDGYWILSFVTGIQNLYSKSIKKIINIKDIWHYKSWRDFFLLGYGMINGILVVYFTVRFILIVANFVIKMIG